MTQPLWYNTAIYGPSPISGQWTGQPNAPQATGDEAASSALTPKTTPPAPLFDTKFFLGEMSEGTYQEFIERTLPKEQKNYFAKQFADMQKNYNTALVAQAIRTPGVDPTTSDPKLETFSDFLKNFNFTDKYFESGPEERAARGESQVARGPRTQFLYN